MAVELLHPAVLFLPLLIHAGAVCRRFGLRALADKVIILLRRHRHPLHIANHRQDEWEIIPECRREAQMLLLDIGTQPQLIPGRV